MSSSSIMGSISRYRAHLLSAKGPSEWCRASIRCISALTRSSGDNAFRAGGIVVSVVGVFEGDEAAASVTDSVGVWSTFSMLLIVVDVVSLQITIVSVA